MSPCNFSRKWYFSDFFPFQKVKDYYMLNILKCMKHFKGFKTYEKGVNSLNVLKGFTVLKGLNYSKGLMF